MTVPYKQVYSYTNWRSELSIIFYILLSTNVCYFHVICAFPVLCELSRLSLVTLQGLLSGREGKGEGL